MIAFVTTVFVTQFDRNIGHWETIKHPSEKLQFSEFEAAFIDFDREVQTYNQAFRPITEEHLRLQKEGDLNREFVVDEYEPFLYSDDVKVTYKVIDFKNVTVGEDSTFTLDTMGAVHLDSRVETLRVLFYGIAVFSPSQFVGDYTGIWKATFRPSDPGLYHVHVQSIFRPNRTFHKFRAIEGSPFTLLVRPTGMKHLADSQVIASLPRSASLHLGAILYPPTPCTNAHRRPGRWVRCHDTPEPCLRTGWVWVPAACHTLVLRPEEVRRSPRPLWVVFAGSSVQRGSFFSFVDFVLGGQAHNLTKSGFWKCWGWMVRSALATR
jgi:hypothetical protein